MSNSPAPIAYFCAEFGLESNLPLYAGGLGILAGDTLKQAAQDNFPLIGIGLLYRGAGAKQTITEDGQQNDEDINFVPQDFGIEPVQVDGMPLFIKVHLTEIDIWLKCWQKVLSPSVTLYLLDTETEQNLISERSITHVLYSGTEESIIKQQLLLGIGGVKLLHELNIHPSMYHVQEGRPAFLHWQLIRMYMDEHGLSFTDAVQIAKSKTVYTNHTLVAAGNQSYDINLLKRYAGYYADKMGVSVDVLLAPGQESDPSRFYVTRFALNISHRASGVSQLHTRLSQSTWPEYRWNNITNGVHLGTWQDNRVKAAGDDSLQLWQAHQQNKQELMEFVAQKTGFGYDPNRLVVTWSRRLAGYKRADCIFADVARLASILKSNQRPIQLLIAGKAHRLDIQGKQLLQSIIHHMKTELSGHALYIPNYNMEVASYLVRGSDVWLNTPEQGKEACGTSGMKAISNGVLQCTVLDGWTVEVDWEELGWSLDTRNVSEELYQALEHKIAPLFYERGDQGFPHDWIERMKRSIALSYQFSADRMLKEYAGLLYSV